MYQEYFAGIIRTEQEFLARLREPKADGLEFLEYFQ